MTATNPNAALAQKAVDAGWIITGTAKGRVTWLTPNGATEWMEKDRVSPGFWFLHNSSAPLAPHHKPTA